MLINFAVETESQGRLVPREETITEEAITVEF